MKNICVTLMTTLILCSFALAPAFAKDDDKRERPRHGSEMKKPDHKKPDFQKPAPGHKGLDFKDRDDKKHSLKKPEHRYDKRRDARSFNRDSDKGLKAEDRFGKKDWKKEKDKDRYDRRHSRNKRDHRG